jgi:hypothetical protein
MYGGTRRKFVKVVIAVDVRTRRLLSVEASVQGEGSSEPEVAASEVRRLHGEGKKVRWSSSTGTAHTTQRSPSRPWPTPARRPRSGSGGTRGSAGGGRR